MRTVMAFGTFDLLHKGHIFYLSRAKALGDKLIVVIARDENVLKLKGKKPVHSEGERLNAVQALDFVDQAVLGDREMRKWGVIKKFHPTIIALGYDQWASIPSLQGELAKINLNPGIERIESYKPKKYSTSKIRETHFSSSE